MLIQHYRHRGLARMSAGEQAPLARRSLKAPGGYPPVYKSGSIRGRLRPSGALLLASRYDEHTVCGDVFASPGRQIVADNLPRIVSEERIHLTIANVENAAGGFGITPLVAEELFSAGLDVLTSGNHIWTRKKSRSTCPGSLACCGGQLSG